MRDFNIAVLFTFCIIICSNLNAETDVVQVKLDAGKAEFDSAVEKARAALIVLLQKKSDGAKKAGDLKLLEEVQKELTNFDESGELPKTVPSNIYVSQVRIARAKMETEYKAAIKQYTKDDKLPLAKVIQQELEEFLNSDLAVTLTLLKRGSQYRGNYFRREGRDTIEMAADMYVLSRTKTEFVAELVMDQKTRVIIKGTIKQDGTVSCKYDKVLAGVWRKEIVDNAEGTGKVTDGGVSLTFVVKELQHVGTFRLAPLK